MQNNQPNDSISRVTGVSLDEETIAIVNEFKDSSGINNFSAAMRFIVNEWNNNCRARPVRKKGKTGPLGRR